MPSSFVATCRYGTFGFVILTSFILVGLCAHVVHATTQLGFSFPFANLGIAASVLAILTLSAMLIIDNLRRGAVTSMIVVEIVWLDILWILFLATAGSATQNSALTNELCFLRDFGPTGGVQFGLNGPTICREYKVIQAFAYLTWLALLIYTLILSAFSIKLSNRGYHRVWYQSVRQTGFNTPPVDVTPMTMPTQHYTPPA